MDLCQLPGLMIQESRLAKLEPVQPRTRAASAAAVDSAGILKLKVLYTVNIKMWRHPKYYKELRKRNRDLSELQQIKLERSVPQSDQVISKEPATAGNQRSPGPGPKHQATSHKLPGPRPISNASKGLIHKRKAASVKHQAVQDS